MNLNKNGNEKEVPIIKFFEKVNVRDSVKDKTNFILSTNELNFEDFNKILIRVNGLIRGININERSFSSTVLLGGTFGVTYLPPKDKDYYLQILYNNLILLDNNRDIGIMLYYGLQFIHPFPDGNGRTGRFFFELLDSNYNIEDTHKYEKVLENEKGRSGFDLPSPELIGYISSMIFFKNNGVTFLHGLHTIDELSNFEISRKNIIDNERANIAQSILDHNFKKSPFSFRDYIIFKINDNKSYVETKEVRGGKMLGLDGKRVLGLLDDDDIDFIINEYAKYEREFLGNIMDLDKLKSFISILENNNVNLESQLFDLVDF